MRKTTEMYLYIIVYKPLVVSQLVSGRVSFVSPLDIILSDEVLINNIYFLELRSMLLPINSCFRTNYPEMKYILHLSPSGGQWWNKYNARM